MGRAGMWIVAAALVWLASGCEWREIQRRNELPTCVQEQAEYPGDLFEALAQVESNLIEAERLRDASKPSYRALLDSLYDASLAVRALPVDGETLCRDVEDCTELVRPEVNVAYPHCYREIAREYDLPDSTGFWARQDEVWDGFFRRGNWRPDDILTSIDATPPDRFAEFEVRAFYTQHVLHVIDISGGDDRP